MVAVKKRSVLVPLSRARAAPLDRADRGPPPADRFPFMGVGNFHKMVRIVIEDYPALEPERNPTRFHLKFRRISFDSRTKELKPTLTIIQVFSYSRTKIQRNFI